MGIIDNEDDSKTIRGRGTISGNKAKRAAKEINKYWSNKTLEKNGVVYHADIQVTVVDECSRPLCHHTFCQINGHKIQAFYDGFATFPS